MPASTAAGWPYVLPADHPKEFPALSQQLATKLQAGPRVVAGEGSTNANGDAIMITFPAGTFASPPRVVATPSQFSPNTFIFVDQRTATGARVSIVNASAVGMANASVQWVAVGT